MQNTGALTALRLERLALIYRQGHDSDLMDKTLEKLFGYEAEICTDQVRQLKLDLAYFEKKYEMSSELFYQKYQNGQANDIMDFIEWASVFQMVKRLEEQIELLSGN